ncbi:MAG: hypothetical protein RBS37_05960 [Bacteroidales bacterium]|jgi:uncharacterized membrane-anchored protein|nr:hypothetical protein [Bacteroidales bacterium]
MKRTAIALLVSILVLASALLWFSTSRESIGGFELSQFLVILLLVGFGFYFAYRRFTSARRGEPVEDEMSKKEMMRASSLSYFISIYLWLAIMYISYETEMDTEVLIGTGIIGMALIFAICWIVIHLRGIRNG